MLDQKNTLIKVNPKDYTEKMVEDNYVFISEHSIVVCTSDGKYSHLFDTEFLVQQVLHWLDDEENRFYFPSKFFADIFGDIHKNEKFHDYLNSIWKPNQIMSEEEFMEKYSEEIFISNEGLTPDEFWSSSKTYEDQNLYSSSIEAAVMFWGKKLSLSRIIAHKFIERGLTPFFSFKPLKFEEIHLEGYPDLTPSLYFETDLEEYPHVKDSFLQQLREVRDAEL